MVAMAAALGTLLDNLLDSSLVVVGNSMVALGVTLVVAQVALLDSWVVC
jgi:hypothetical protein